MQNITNATKQNMYSSLYVEGLDLGMVSCTNPVGPIRPPMATLIKSNPIQKRSAEFANELSCLDLFRKAFIVTPVRESSIDDMPEFCSDMILESSSGASESTRNWNYYQLACG